ncbi:hypothetical protein [Alistipes sp.]|uniref:hypothetical protein n=1 Tax=Alistipes sp. TaxID=1872444 RepID=UPI0011C8EEC5
MGKCIVPYGPGNDLPVMVRDLVQDNNLAPGILQRQKGLLYDQGAFLCKRPDARVIYNGLDDYHIRIENDFAKYTDIMLYRA